MLTTEDKMPPKNKYSRRLASRAAPVKQAKTAVDARNAKVTILQQVNKQELVL